MGFKMSKANEKFHWILGMIIIFENLIFLTIYIITKTCTAFNVGISVLGLILGISIIIKMLVYTKIK